MSCRCPICPREGFIAPAAAEKVVFKTATTMRRVEHSCRSWAARAGKVHRLVGFAFVASAYPASVEEVDCEAMIVDGMESDLSQWQQDWFVYHNFIKGTSLDRGGSRRGLTVDVGAFHPFQLSNTFFFERCLGWQGLCVEPNPDLGRYFRAFRPSCKLMRNCVWSHARNVTMSYEKDPIEAYIQKDPEEVRDGAPSGSSGAVLITSEGAKRPVFMAQCRRLQDILGDAGLRRPTVIDYMSVDAEAAEVEIFRDFPFADFDISVISVEIQLANYYDMDVIFSVAGFVKVAVLGGDHVYAKLKRPLELPVTWEAWQQKLSKDFYTHAEPRTPTARS
eukprot:TRINITY_DN44474_c0_g1_i1.p1 TRINITY_DN44474_c0_g1~~TRINITY_DN44474_c0_g1_i1.p1  ORF type:complete len:334 (-),score=45.78 TRINITY_DN44474_c0_g1_i1:45-1046(-)